CKPPPASTRATTASTWKAANEGTVVPWQSAGPGAADRARSTGAEFSAGSPGAGRPGPADGRRSRQRRPALHRAVARADGARPTTGQPVADLCRQGDPAGPGLLLPQPERCLDTDRRTAAGHPA